MSTPIETEVKFHIADLDRLAARLESLGAQLSSPRTFEFNLRFDTPAGEILRDNCVLRLRRNAESRLTFKGVSESREGVLIRQEIEFTVGDFDAAQQFLEALGYQIVALYEKYRTTYALGEIHFMLDELPYGDFFEIEGPDVATLQRAALNLDLDWNAAIGVSYTGIFHWLCKGIDLDETHLTFDALKELVLDLREISIYAADK